MQEVNVETQGILNQILGACFDLNARSDSIAYSMSFNLLEDMSRTYHTLWAHYWPTLADAISDKMLEYNVLPIREALPKYDYNTADHVSLFRFNKEGADGLASLVRKGIEMAEYNEDLGIKIFLEEIYNGLSKYVKQADFWSRVSETVSSDHMNVHFDKYTKFI